MFQDDRDFVEKAALVSVYDPPTTLENRHNEIAFFEPPEESSKDAFVATLFTNTRIADLPPFCHGKEWCASLACIFRSCKNHASKRDS